MNIQYGCGQGFAVLTGPTSGLVAKYDTKESVIGIEQAVVF